LGPHRPGVNHDAGAGYMNEAPFSARRHRIGPGPAQKAEIVGVQQLLNGVGITIELLLEKVDGAGVLIAAKNQLLFAVALGLLIDAGQCRQ